MRRIALATGICLCAVLLGAASAQAAPTWLSPQNVFSTPVTSIQNDSFFNRKALDVASDGGGDSIAVWIEERPKVPGPGTVCQAMWALRPAGGSFGAPQALAPEMSLCTGQIKLAMNESGTAVVGWKQEGHIDAALRPPGGAFSSATQLDSASATDDPWVSINASGVAAITWDDTAVGGCAGLTTGINWAFHAVIVRPGIGFGGVETVCDASHPSGPTIYTPRSVVDPQGDVIATWVNSYFDGTNTHIAVEWAYRPAGGTFNGATPHVFTETLNPVAAAGSFAADVAVDSQGHATAVWPYNNGSKTVIETAVRPAGVAATFGLPGPASGPTAAGDSSSPRLAVDPSTNTAVAVWVQCSSGSCQVEATSRSSGGGFGAPQALSAPGATTTFGPLVAFAPSGSATTIWSGPSPDISGTQIQATTRPSGVGQGFGAVTTISNANPSQSPAIAFDGEGNAIALWEHDTTSPTGALLQYAGFDAAGPDIQSVSAPNGTAGKPVSFSATALDRWSASSVAWSFGDGGTATGATVTHKYKKRGSYQVTVKAIDAVGNESRQTRTIKIAKAKHKKCKKGFRKKRVKGKKAKGKTHCVKVKHHHHKKKHRHR